MPLVSGSRFHLTIPETAGRLRCCFYALSVGQPFPSGSCGLRHRRAAGFYALSVGQPFPCASLGNVFMVTLGGFLCP